MKLKMSKSSLIHVVLSSVIWSDEPFKTGIWSWTVIHWEGFADSWQTSKFPSEVQTVEVNWWELFDSAVPSVWFTATRSSCWSFTGSSGSSSGCLSSVPLVTLSASLFWSISSEPGWGAIAKDCRTSSGCCWFLSQTEDRSYNCIISGYHLWSHFIKTDLFLQSLRASILAWYIFIMNTLQQKS